MHAAIKFEFLEQVPCVHNSGDKGEICWNLQQTYARSRRGRRSGEWVEQELESLVISSQN